MKPLYLKFESQQHAHSTLLAHGFELDGLGKLTHRTADIYEVGVIRGIITTDGDGNVTHQEPDVVGYHVNLLVPDDYTPPKSAVVLAVKTPVVRWAGY